MFNFGNGKTLIDLIPDGLSHAATSFVESLKINSITEKSRRHRRIVVKRRNLYGERAAALINFYFRAAGIPIRYVSNVREWRRWEMRCFQMLNGDRFRAKVINSRTVTLDKLPGDNLWEHMNRGTLTPQMLKAAGSEYRRAHHFQSKELGCPWSHGDASMTNVIYDEKTKRTRLIDFEIRHEKSLPFSARHGGKNPNAAMVALRHLFSARLRQPSSSSPVKEAPRCSKRPRFHLVERANQFHSERKSNPAVSSVASRHRQTRIQPVRLGSLSLACD